VDSKNAWNIPYVSYFTQMIIERFISEIFISEPQDLRALVVDKKNDKDLSVSVGI